MISTRVKIGVVIAGWFTMLANCSTVLGAPPATQPGVPWTAVKLHVKNVTARQALDELTKQTHIAFQGEIPAIEDQLNNIRLSLDLEGQPLMSAVVAICDATDLRPVGYTPDKPGIKLGTSDGGMNVKCSDVRGAFAVGVIRVEQNLRIDYASPANGFPPSFTLMLTVCPEPTQHVQRISSLHLTRVLDETGFPITDPGQGVSPTMMPPSPRIQIRAQSGSKLSLVQGEFTAVIEKEHKHVEIADVFKVQDVPQTAGDAHLQIRSFTRNGRQYALQVVVLRKDMDDDRLKKVVESISHTRPVFISGSGENVGLMFGGLNIRPVPAGTLVTFNFNPTNGRPEPAKLVWDLPTDTTELILPFSLKDVPLPSPTQTPGKALAAKPPTTLPAVARTEVDVARQVRDLLPLLSAVTAEDRQDAQIRLALLPAAAFSTVETAAKDPNVPPATKQILSTYLRERGPLQEARLRRAKAVEDERNWEEAASLDAYGRFGKRNAKWDNQVREALHLYFTTNGLGPKTAARAAFESAIEAGCEDPLVLSLAGYTIEISGGNPRQVLKLYQQADLDIRNSRYPDYFKLWNAIRYCSLLRRTSSAETNARGDRFLPKEDAQILNRLRQSILIFFPTAVKIQAPPSKLLAAAQRVLSIFHAANAEMEPVFNRITPALAAALPNRPEPLVLKGTFYTDWAWEARGNGTAGTVTDKGWTLFRDRLDIAETALKNAYEIDPNDPAAPTAMLTVELGQGKGKDVMEQWFKRALQADPDNLTACTAKLYYLEPKWHGSPQEMLQFGQECLKSGNYLARFPMVLMDAHKSISVYAESPEIYFKNVPKAWQDAKQVYEPYLRVRPEDADARSAYCYYACVSGHWALAKEQFEILGDNIVPRYFGHGSMEDVKEYKKKAQAAGKSDGL